MAKGGQEIPVLILLPLLFEGIKSIILFIRIDSTAVERFEIFHKL